MADELEDSSASGEPGVGFLYKTMLERDPKKRRVKPVQKHLLTLDFGLSDDSDDDSDFEVEKQASDTDNSNDDINDDDDNADSHDSEDSSSDSDSENGSIDDEEGELSLNDMLDRVKSRQKESVTPSLDSSGHQKKMKVLICCVCLGEHNEEEDEIVECDNCGVLVHEGCYGISESQSVASTESSASTEPWFCDACKAGVDNPCCELCPNLGGIFKETDAGRWVHIVCALYVPGVAFGDVDKLSVVTLFEMPYSKWGAKECYLCEDERFSRTGICVCCDAGMCRNYFHVTCAQKEGLLSEANPDEDIADPFYAYCKLHAEKTTVRSKKRNWLAIQSFNKKKAQDNDVDTNEAVRVQRKLRRHRRKFQEAKLERSPPWMPPEKWPRLVTSSASAVRRLIQKAELLGISTQLHHHSVDKAELRKRPNVAPAMSVEFVAYFLERNSKMSTMKSHLKDLLVQNEKLQQQEKILRNKYEQLSSDVRNLSSSNGKLVHEGENIWKCLSGIADKKLSLPDVLKPKKISKTPLKRSVSSVPRSPPAIIHQCGLCHKTNNQHLLARCDMCKLYYHLGCLDPPLTRMPKKTKLQGWQCSECAKSSSDEEKGEEKVNTDAPRKLRQNITLPKKFTPVDDEKKIKRPRSGPSISAKRKLDKEKKPKRTPTKEKEPSEEKTDECHIVSDDVDDEPVLKKEKTIYTYSRETPRPAHRPKKAVEKVEVKCANCDTDGNTTNMVTCDECKKSCHFHCLDPPLKKTPKRKGYTWHCEECDNESEESESDENDTVLLLESDDNDHRMTKRTTEKSDDDEKEAKEISDDSD